MNEEESNNISFFLRNNNFWGSPNKIFIGLCCISLFGGMLLAIMNGFELIWIALIYDALAYLFEFIVIGILWCKIPTYLMSKDTTGVYKETQYFIRIGLVVLGIYIIDTILKAIFGDPYAIYSELVSNTLIKALILVCGLITCCYVSYHDKITQKLMNIQDHRISITLHQIFDSPQYIDIFFEHLSNEHSPELLLAYVEFNQFKLYMQNDSELLNHLNKQNLIEPINLSKDIPQSSILNNEYSYGFIIDKLYDKYIQNGSRFQINIPHRTHETLTFLANKYDETKEFTLKDKEALYSMYDDAIKCLFKLMSHSLNRLRLYSAVHSINNFEHCIQQI